MKHSTLGRPKLQLHELECRATPALAATIVADSLTAPEGSHVELTSTVTDATTPTYQWTVIKDGGATPFATGTEANFSFTPDDNGTYDVTLVVTDTGVDPVATTTDTETITAINVPPLASISGPSVGVPGLPLPFTLMASDASSVDEAAGFTFNIDWGDGTSDEVTGLSGTVVTHVYSTTGTNTITVTATDKDDGVSAAVTQSVAIETAAVLPDPLNPGGTLLAVGGTMGDDKILLNPGGSGRIRVSVDGERVGVFGGANRIAVYGLDGDDNIQLAGSLRTPAWLDGGEGNDRLKGAKGRDVLRGGPGDDNMNGHQGDDIMIGGLGADQMIGGPGNEILIAGTSAYDANEPALFEIAGIWGGGGSVQARIDALQSSATVPLVGDGATPTVVDDGAPDLLNGTSGSAWVFANTSEDRVVGKKRGLFLDEIDVTGVQPGNDNGNDHGNGHGNGPGNRPGNGNGPGHSNAPWNR